MKLKIIDKLLIGNRISITVEGICENLRNNDIVVDEKQRKFNIISIGMTHHKSPEDIKQITNILIEGMGTTIGQFIRKYNN